MTPTLSLSQLQKSYGTQSVLDGVTFDVPPGSIVGLLGPNGAGKSTLIRSIMGIVEPDGGEVLIGGQPWSREGARGIGYLPEERGLYRDMSVGQQAVYFAQLKGMKKPEAVASLKTWFERLEVQGWWDKKVSDISKGMAQKIQFICTVVHQPKLLILDEPLSGFDPINARRIIEVVRSLAADGTSVLLSTHDMPSVERLVRSSGHVESRSRGVCPVHLPSSERQDGTGVQEVLFKGNDMSFTHALGALANLDSIGPTSMSGVRKASIRLRDGVGPADVLRALTQTIEVMEFIKVRPTMESLFIDAVSNVESETTAEA